MGITELTLEQAIEQMDKGAVLRDVDGVRWRRYEGRYECRWPETGMNDWRPFGRGPMASDAPFIVMGGTDGQADQGQ